MGGGRIGHLDVPRIDGSLTDRKLLRHSGAPLPAPIPPHIGARCARSRRPTLANSDARAPVPLAPAVEVLPAADPGLGGDELERSAAVRAAGTQPPHGNGAPITKGVGLFADDLVLLASAPKRRAHVYIGTHDWFLLAVLLRAGAATVQVRAFDVLHPVVTPCFSFVRRQGWSGLPERMYRSRRQTETNGDNGAGGARRGFGCPPPTR
jgi:hypothetical protein